MAALLAAVPAAAQPQPTFVAKVDRTRATVGEPFVYEVTLSLQEGRLQGYTAPDFKGCRVLAELPSQSTQIQMAGGTTTTQAVYSWRYELVPLDKGILTIPAARARVGGRELRTTAVTVSVVEGGGAAPAAPRRGVSPFGALPFGVDPAPAAGDGRSFIRVVPSKTRVYVGEQVTVEWSLYLTERADKYQPIHDPRTDGFWTEELPSPNARGLQLTPEFLDGQSYLVASLSRKALFPLQPGRLTITPMESEISHVDFFGSTMRTQRLKTDPLVIEALPLPTAGQPRGFDPAAVGKFELAAKVDRERVAVGEAVTLTLAITGRGNLRKLTPPPLEPLPGWKTYDPKVSVTIEPGEVIGGVKTVEYLLLPERPGTTTIPAFTLPYFDPSTKGYVSSKSAPLRVEVVGEAGSAQPGKPGGAPAATVVGTGAENVVGVDVRPPRRTFRRDLGTTLYRSRAFAAALAAPPLALALTVMVGRIRERLSQDTQGARRRKLRRLVRRHLRAAEGHLEAGRAGPFFMEIERVLNELLSGKLRRPVTGLSRDELRDALTAAGASLELAERTIAELEECDRARFAPGSVAEAEMRAALERAGEIILQLQRAKLREGEA